MTSGYTNVFTGNQTQPASFSLNPYSLTANVTFTWPTEAATSGPFVASINIVTPNAGALVITMPPANQAGAGNSSEWYNAGSNTYTVNDNSGAAITTVASGQWKRVILQDNSTAKGIWLSYQEGTGTSSATAASLAGSGLSALSGTTLNINETVTTKNVNYTILTGDRAILLVWTGGSGTFTLPSAASALGGYKVAIRNGGTGALTVTPAGGDTINTQSTLSMAPSDSCYFDTDGVSAWYTIGLPRSIIYAVTYQNISLTGQSGNYALAGTQLNQSIYLFTGLLAGNTTVQTTSNVAIYVLNNQTTGAFTLTFSTVAGTGVLITQGQSTQVYCDGTNVNYADQFGGGLPVPIGSGGTNATTAAAARTSLGTQDESFALSLILG